MAKTYNRMTRKSLYSCKNTRAQRWGQSIVNNFGLKDNKSYASYVERLWYADDETVKTIVEEMCVNFQLD